MELKRQDNCCNGKDLCYVFCHFLSLLRARVLLNLWGVAGRVGGYCIEVHLERGNSKRCKKKKPQDCSLVAFSRNILQSNVCNLFLPGILVSVRIKFVYEFKCNLCDAGYVGYTRGHLHERVEGHTRKPSSIYKHYNLQHNSEMPERFIEQFHTIAKCSGKFDCLVKGMLYIRMRKPTLNVQTDSIRAKVFV